jgi:hypothetical protein
MFVVGSVGRWAGSVSIVVVGDSTSEDGSFVVASGALVNFQSPPLAISRRANNDVTRIRMRNDVMETLDTGCSRDGFP